MSVCQLPGTFSSLEKVWLTQFRVVLARDATNSQQQQHKQQLRKTIIWKN
jgi:hypothetical protein